MTYYTGLDVSLRSVSICIIDDKGAIQHEAKVAADVDLIVRCLHDFSLDVNAVAFEAGALTQYHYHPIKEADSWNVPLTSEVAILHIEVSSGDFAEQS